MSSLWRAEDDVVPTALHYLPSLLAPGLKPRVTKLVVPMALEEVLDDWAEGCGEFRFAVLDGGFRRKCDSEIAPPEEPPEAPGWCSLKYFIDER